VDVNDYLLPMDGIDWGEVLAPWGTLLPDEFTLWFANCYGEPILVLDDGSVHRLDFEGGELERLADSQDALNDALDDPENVADWLMIPLVDEVRAAGLELGAGQSYGFAIPTIVGGEYELDNTRVKTLAEYAAFLAGVHDKIRDLPDGAQVELSIDD
jgi:hypothetical protein